MKKIFAVPGKCPVKMQILVNSFSTVQVTNLSSKPLPLLQLQSLKSKHCIQELANLFQKIKKDYGSLHKASVAMHVHWTTFNQFCKPPEKRVKKIKEQWVDIRTFYSRDNVSTELPLAWAKGHRYLTKTLEETYTMYKEHCLKNSKKSVAFSTFCKMRPVKIYKIAQTPDRQCICDTCENFRLLHQAMKVNSIKGIEQHTDLCRKQSLCTVNLNESNKGSNSASEEIDGCHQVDPSYGYFSCISHNCKCCM